MPDFTQTVTIAVPFTVRADRMERAQAAIRSFIAGIEANEPDTIVYRSYQSANAARRFWHYMLFKDEAAHVKHRDSSYCADFVKTLYPCCEEMPKPEPLQLFDEAATTSVSSSSTTTTTGAPQ